MKITGYYVVFIVCACAAVGLAYNTKRFEYSGYCQKMCRYGRGGNLCRCNAVHFAGKRVEENVLGSNLDTSNESIRAVVEGGEDMGQNILSLIPAYKSWMEKKIRDGQLPESFKEFISMQPGNNERR